VTEFALPSSTAQPEGIAPGSDGNLWFTEVFGDAIGRISTNG
jgi:virginiamycin B lyase